MLERAIPGGYVRVNYFTEEISDVIESQTTTLDNGISLRTFLPVDEIETSGIEFIANAADMFVPNLDVRFNVVYTDSEIMKNNPNPSIEGNVCPRMPDWRGNLLANYRLSNNWDIGVNLQYASDSFGRTDNTDNENNVYSALDRYTRFGLKSTYRLDNGLALGVGVDNLTDEVAYVAHPWPGRTFYVNMAYDFYKPKNRVLSMTINSVPLKLPRILLVLLSLAIQLGTANSAMAADCSDAQISVHCGSTPSATIDADGRLWVTHVQNQHVYVSHSDDLGKTYSQPVAVNAVAEDTEHIGENRPKIIVDGDSNIYISWTRKTSPRFTGEIKFSRSTDAGRTFETPRIINDDGLFTGHRFESLFQTESGLLYLTWVDKRDLDAHIERGEEYSGAAIYYTVSADQGATFSTNYRVADNSCECCRIAISPRGPDNIANLWRQIFGVTTRDHAIAVLTPDGQMMEMGRASYDEWQINACPHHGPSMVQSSVSGDYHMSWFTNGDLHQGIYYGRYSFDTASSTDVYQVDSSAGAGHPYLAELNEKLYLVWKSFDGQQSLLQLITSTDDGSTWSDTVTLSSTSQALDHPMFVTTATGIFLSWHTEEYGYVFQEITDSTMNLSDYQAD